MPDTNEEMIDLPSEGKSVNVEVEAVVAEAVEAGAESSGEAEHEEYSQKVQKRIDKLTRKVREAERQQKAAIDFAQGLQKENSSLKTKVKDLDAGYVNEYGDRIASQSASLEKDLEVAIATNNTSEQVALNKKLGQLAIEEERVKAAKLEQERILKQVEAQQTQAMAQESVPVRADPKAEEWASKNDWFGEDDAMTFAAFGIHKTLVENEGFDTNSPEYYDEIDKRMRDAFPHKFNGVAVEETVTISEARRPQQAVASAVRSSNSGRKTVRLSPSEVAIAKKLGVPLDEYAKHKAS
tara:strand:+ start:4243 stop:5130 length:888 start_codon:yes stop_codon:yes gene_type:complete